MSEEQARAAGLALILLGWAAIMAIMLSGCGNPADYCGGEAAPITAKVVNGTESTDRRATVFVHTDRGRCTGVVIGPRTVLTAAHCYGDNPRIQFYIHTVEVRATDSLLHPHYEHYPFHDIWLLYFPQDLPGPYVGTLYDPIDALACDGLVAQGWGRSEVVGRTLREADYQVDGYTDKVLTTSKVGGNGSACSGDSGGPLYAYVGGELQLAGSLSTGLDLECLIGGQHVNLLYYKDWLEENTR